MNTVHGRVVLREGGTGLGDLLVSLYSTTERAQPTRVASVLTADDGRFTISYEIMGGAGGKAPAAPPPSLTVVVTAADAGLDGAEPTAGNLGWATRRAGSDEAFIFRIGADQLAAAGLEVPRPVPQRTVHDVSAAIDAARRAAVVLADADRRRFVDDLREATALRRAAQDRLPAFLDALVPPLAAEGRRVVPRGGSVRDVVNEALAAGLEAVHTARAVGRLAVTDEQRVLLEKSANELSEEVDAKLVENLLRPAALRSATAVTRLDPVQLAAAGAFDGEDVLDLTSGGVDEERAVGASLSEDDEIAAPIASFSEAHHLRLAFEPVWQEVLDAGVIDRAAAVCELLIDAGEDPVAYASDLRMPTAALRGAQAAMPRSVVHFDDNAASAASTVDGSAARTSQLHRAQAALRSALDESHRLTVHAASGVERSVNFGALLTYRQTWTPLTEGTAVDASWLPAGTSQLTVSEALVHDPATTSDATKRSMRAAALANAGASRHELTASVGPVSVSEHLHRVTPVVLVAQELPEAINASWIAANEWVVREALLDASLADALGDPTQLDRVRVHIKANLLHYLQAAWRNEPADQRRARLGATPVPVLQGRKSYTVAEDPDGVPAPPAWTVPLKVSMRCRIDTKVGWRPLEQAADLDTLLGFEGNSAIFPLRRSNIVTDLVMLPYLDAALGVHDPDRTAPMTPSELVACVTQLAGHLPRHTFDDLHQAIAATTERAAIEHVDSEVVLCPARPPESRTTNSGIAELVGDKPPTALAAGMTRS